MKKKYFEVQAQSEKGFWRNIFEDSDVRNFEKESDAIEGMNQNQNYHKRLRVVEYNVEVIASIAKA